MLWGSTFNRKNAGTQVPCEKLGPWGCWTYFHRPQEYQTHAYQCKNLPFLFIIRSWRGITVRLEKFWPWWTRASLIKGNPVKRTEGNTPKSKLKTFPYFFTSWKIVEESQLHMYISVYPVVEGTWSWDSLYWGEYVCVCVCMFVPWAVGTIYACFHFFRSQLDFSSIHYRTHIQYKYSTICSSYLDLVSICILRIRHKNTIK